MSDELQTAVSMVERRSWEEFRESGLLWWVNRTLHLFGWSIVVVLDDETDKVLSVYPARTKYRGFSEDVEDTNFLRLSQYMADNGAELVDEVKRGQ